MNHERAKRWLGFAALAVVALLAARKQLPRIMVDFAGPEPAAEFANFAPAIEPLDGVPPLAIEKNPAQVQTRIEIIGPRDVVVGDPVYLRAQTAGTILGIHWTVKRSGEDTSELDGLVEVDDGQAAWFTSRDLGDYEVICSVADAEGRSAHDAHHFAILSQAATLTPAGLVEPTKELDVAHLIRVWLAEVATPAGSQNPDGERRAEAIVLAGSLRGTAQAIRAGQVADDADPTLEAARAGEVALGPVAFRRWEPFMLHVRELAEYLASSGELDGETAWVNLLENVAALVEAWSGE